MSWVRTGWLLFLVVSFAVFEGWALMMDRATLSRFVWTLSKAWPPLPFVCGLIAGGLAVHFWWIGQACDLMGH